MEADWETAAAGCCFAGPPAGPPAQMPGSSHNYKSNLLQKFISMTSYHIQDINENPAKQIL